MKQLTPQQKFQDCRAGIIDSSSRWKELNSKGGNDPQWNDGYNMNLVRNHILYYKHQIRELCEEQNWKYPYEYYIPTPPPVPDSYMANEKQTERIKQLLSLNCVITFEKNRYDDSQLTFL